MKLTASGARAFCARPDTAKCGALLYGTDTSLVALARRELVQALTSGDDLRLTRVDGTQAARDPAGVDAALRSRGFFGERPVVLIEGAGEALSRPLADILSGIRAEDAFLVATAGSLPARSTLRKLFEADDRLVALSFHGGPLERSELEDMLAEKGIQGGLTPDALAELAACAETIDRGVLMQVIEKIAVYMLGREAQLDAPELTALLPAAAETELDRLVSVVAAGRVEDVKPLITRLAASGLGPVTLLIATVRHFRLLLGLATAPDGIGSALGRIRPPLYGPRRDAVAAQARRWRAAQLETAMRLLFRTDRQLRSPGSRPDHAIVERCLIRLAMMAARDQTG